MHPDDFGIKESIKINIRKFREANGLTQTQLGEILGTGRTTYTKWESGDTLPNPIQLATLALIYNKKMDDFFTNQNSFMVAQPGFGDVYGDDYLSELNDEERVLLAKFRMLKKTDKEKVNEYIDEIKKQS